MQAGEALEKVRKLLDKAESTPFEAEAATYIAKAQELMQLFAIGEAQIEMARAEQHRQKPIIRHFTIGEMRAGIQHERILLNVVAKHNRCKMWMTVGTPLCHVAGFEADVMFVDILFTSLRAQMQRSRVFAWAQQPDTASRKTFNAEFAAGYVHRINQRFDEQAVASLTSMASDNKMILRHRKDAVDMFVRHFVGELRRSNMRDQVRNSDYRAAGREAGSKADMGISGGGPKRLNA